MSTFNAGQSSVREARPQSRHLHLTTLAVAAAVPSIGKSLRESTIFTERGYADSAGLRELSSACTARNSAAL